MNKLILALCVLLLLSLAANWLIIHRHQQYKKLSEALEQVSEMEYRNKSAAQLQRMAIRDSAISIRIKELQEDSLSHAAVQGSLKSQIRAFRIKLQNLPPAVHDTVIFLQDSLIADLQQERDTVYLESSAVIDSLQLTISDLHDLFTGELKQNIVLRDRLEREKRKRFSLGPAVSYGFRGADVGISVQYSIFKF
jgi:hypothetical protein